MITKTLLTGICGLAAATALLFSAQDGGAQEEINPADFSPSITNPLFPLSLVGPKLFEGEDTDPDTGEVVETRLESRVLPETTVVAGVTVTVLEEKAFDDGELVELALDYFAQHKNGDVYYFGERVDNYEDGQLKDHHGQWLAGEDGALPGVYMAANPEVGKTYEQELAPGVAEDKSEVLGVHEKISVPAGSYDDCVRTRDFTPLEPGIEEIKWHCAGVGLVREEGSDSVNELVTVAAEPAATPTSSAVTTAPTSAPGAPTDVAVPNTGSGAAASGSQTWQLAAMVLAGLALVASGIAVGLRFSKERA